MSFQRLYNSNTHIFLLKPQLNFLLLAIRPKYIFSEQWEYAIIYFCIKHATNKYCNKQAAMWPNAEFQVSIFGYCCLQYLCFCSELGPLERSSPKKQTTLSGKIFPFLFFNKNKYQFLFFFFFCWKCSGKVQ